MLENKDTWYKITFIFQFSNHNFIIWYQLEQKYIFWLTFWVLKLKLKIKEMEIFLKKVFTFRECLTKKISLKMDKMLKSTIKNNKFATTDYITLKKTL